MNLPNEIQYEIITALGGPKSVAAEIDEIHKAFIDDGAVKRRI